MRFASTPMAACEGADALVIVTEWKEFRSPDFDALRRQLKAAAACSTAATCTSRRSCARPASNTSRSAAGDARDREAVRARASRPGATRVAQARVLVVGDVMLDRYWFGDVERISPEAPVPVVRIARTRGAPRRRGQRRAQRRGARRAHDAAVGHRRRRGRATRSRTLLAARPRADVASCATRRCRRRSSCASSAGSSNCCASTSRPRRRTKCWRRSSPTTSGCVADADVVILSDYGKGGLAHIATMIERARARRASRCWSTRRATTGRGTAARR